MLLCFKRVLGRLFHLVVHAAHKVCFMLLVAAHSLSWVNKHSSARVTLLFFLFGPESYFMGPESYEWLPVCNTLLSAK